jgi:purine-cytosine permease-like protein
MPSSDYDRKDLEADLPDKEYVSHSNNDELHSIDETVRAKTIAKELPVFKHLKKGEDWLDAKLGVETQGINRVLEEDKRPPSILNVFLLWFSLNIHVGVIPLGLLGAEFGLTLKQNIAATTIGSALGALCTAYDGTLSPKLGLRQIAVSRYSFGFWGAKLCSVLNIIVGGGFFVVNLVVVGQLLSAVSDYSMTLSVGIVVIAVVSYILSIFGYRLIHTYEKYSWIFTFILLLVLVGQAAPHVDVNATGA